MKQQNWSERGFFFCLQISASGLSQILIQLDIDTTSEYDFFSVVYFFVPKNSIRGWKAVSCTVFSEAQQSFPSQLP